MWGWILRAYRGCSLCGVRLLNIFGVRWFREIRKWIHVEGMLKSVGMGSDEGESEVDFCLIYSCFHSSSLKDMMSTEAPFRHPFTMCVSGCTGSGKSQWVLRLLKHAQQLISPPPRALLYCYGELNEEILRLQQQEASQNFGDDQDRRPSAGWQLHVHQGVPDSDAVQRIALDSDGRLLLVLDDLMVGLRAQFLDILFTRGSHNWGCSVVLVTQHLFASKELRVARCNSHYLVLLRNPVGALQVRNLAQQLFPGPNTHRFFMEVYEDATRERFSYLLVDMHPATPDAFRLKTHIYPGELCVVYMPIDGSSTAVKQDSTN